MRKIFGIVAITLAAGCAFATGCSGCNGNGKNIAPLSSNWYSYTGFGNIQPTFIENKANFSKEAVTYDVKFIKPENGNASYSVDYTDGLYSTEFYAKTFDVTDPALVHEDFKEGYEGKNITAYYYKTAFTAKVTFTYGKNSTAPLDETVTTECYFLSVDDHLRPLYSKQVVKSPSPNAYSVSSLDVCYKLYDEEYTNYYSYNGKTVITDIKDNLNEKNNSVKKRGVGGTSNSLFDVTSLEIALRGLIASGFSQKIDLYTPKNSVQSFTLTSPSAAIGDDTVKETVKSVLQSKKLYVTEYDKENKEIGLQTTAVTVTSNSSLSGVSQTYWFSKVTNKRNNAGRATLLKISVPIVYHLGTLEYTLKEVSSTLWSDAN